MSPEQFLGVPADARSDLFSLGIMLYQMLTGDRPFSGAPSTIMQKVLRQDPVQPSVLNPTLSPAWDDLIKRALAKKPEERIQSARQFAEYMHLVAEGKPLPGTAPSGDATVVIDATVRVPPPTPPAPPRGRRNLFALAGGAILAVAAVGAGLVYVFNKPSAVTAPVAKAPEPPVEAKPTSPPAPVAKAPEPPVEAKPLPSPAPKPKPVERKVVKPEKPAPRPAPVVQAKSEPPPPPPAPAPVAKVVTPAPAPKPGKVVSLDRSWGFLVVQPGDAAVKVGDRLYANLAAGCARRAQRVEDTRRSAATPATASAPGAATLVPPDLALAFLQEIKSESGSNPPCKFTEKGTWSAGEYRKITLQKAPTQITGYPQWILFKIEDAGRSEERRVGKEC